MDVARNARVRLILPLATCLLRARAVGAHFVQSLYQIDATVPPDTTENEYYVYGMRHEM
jgi:hypothetical protein